ncbi:MAG TPA: hypothetical protein VEC16_05360 [Alphaproteobacteria bacterium]|nr:hypothetical protein [Alphaproteobacteria bacterium]
MNNLSKIVLLSAGMMSGCAMVSMPFGTFGDLKYNPVYERTEVQHQKDIVIGKIKKRKDYTKNDTLTTMITAWIQVDDEYEKIIIEDETRHFDGLYKDSLFTAKICKHKQITYIEQLPIDTSYLQSQVETMKLLPYSVEAHQEFLKADSLNRERNTARLK